MLQIIFPIIQWLKGYSKSFLKKDLVAGVTVGILLIPQGMAYAIVAGLPPVFGLYASVFPPIIYAILGTSNKISIGPVALDSILIIAGLQMLAEPGSDEYLSLAIMLSLLVGIIQTLLGLLRFGFLINFLSYPVILGYTCAAAIIIAGSQLETVFGVNIDNTNVFDLFYQLFIHLSEWNILSIIIGAFAIAFIYILKKVLPKLPYVLILVGIGMFVAHFIDLSIYDISLVRDVPKGLPDISLPFLDAEVTMKLLPTALTVGLMGYVGAISISKSQEKINDKVELKPSQELIAVGVANIVGSLFKGFPVSASFSRSAVFQSSGAKTQLAGVFSSVFILLTLLFLTPVFHSYPLPKVILAAIIIVSVMKLIKVSAVKELYFNDKKDFTVLIVTFLITLIFGVQLGLLIGVLGSVLFVLHHISRPHMAELGLVEGADLYRNIDRFENVIIRKDILIFRFDDRLYFANQSYFKEKLFKWVSKRDLKELKYVVFDAESVNGIDATSMKMLQSIFVMLKQKNIQFLITNLKGPLRDHIHYSVIKDEINEDTMFATVQDAVMFIDKGLHNRTSHGLQRND